MRKGFAGYGYETAGRDRVTALRDMIDGGGKGRSGDKFEGGGILSLIANMVASPYGSGREPGGRSPQAPAQSFRPQMRSLGMAPQALESSLRPQMRPEGLAAEELLGGDQAAYDAAFAAPTALPPGLVQGLSGGSGLASEMVARGLPASESEQSLSAILATMTPEEKAVFLPQILEIGIPMDVLLRR